MIEMLYLSSQNELFFNKVINIGINKSLYLQY